MTRKKPPSAVRRRQRRAVRAKAFDDVARINWLERTVASLGTVQRRMNNEDETVRHAIDHFLQQEHYAKLQRDGVMMEVVDGDLELLIVDGHVVTDRGGVS